MQLDPSQHAVIDLPAGRSAVVLGAPGTGKTTTLVELIAARVASGAVGPDEVLALCASRTAATALRDRLSLRLGVATQGPRARTANSLAFGVLAERAIATGGPEPRLLTGAEQDQLLADLIAGDADDGGIAWPPQLPPEVRALAGFRAELRELMERMVEHGVTPARLGELGRQRELPEWGAAAELIRQFQDGIDSMRPGFVTTAELLTSAAQLVASGAVDPGIRLLVVDDVQEFTRAGLGFLSAFARQGITVIGFGDPDVATATFRGADAGAVARFGERLGIGHLAPLVLGRAHRQPEPLREVTRRITARVGTAAAVGQREAQGAADAAGAPARVESILALSGAQQFATLARRLRELHLRGLGDSGVGVPWGEMAVVVRSGRLVPEVARALAVAEVPTRTTLARGALRDDYAARHLLTAAAVALGLRRLDGAAATELLLGPLGGLDAVQLRRLRLALRHEELAGGGNRPGDVLLAEAVSDPAALTTVGDMAPGRAARGLAQGLEAGREQLAAGTTIEELLWTFWERSGLADRWLRQSARGGVVGDEASRNLDGVVALFAAAKRFVERSPEKPASDFVAEQLEAAVPEDTLAPRALAEAVLVCTPPAAVGLEFAVTAVAAVQEGTWPNVRLRGSLLRPQQLAEVVAGAPATQLDERTEVVHDELRMFALAVSRARELLIVAATEGEDEQPSALVRLVGGEPIETAQHPYTLRGLVGELRRRLAIDAGDAGAAASLATLAEAGVAGADPSEWYGLRHPSTTGPLVELDSDPDATVSVSPSKIDTFEKSPLKWFIEVMSGSSGGLATGVGTIVHAVMEAVSREPGGDISAERIWGDVEQRWAELGLEPGWLEQRERRRVRKMAEGLHDYLAAFRESGDVLLDAEGRFSLRVGPAVINGAIDRVERGVDGGVVIVDLKTGRLVPRAADVPGHPQLSAYQLAYRDGALADAGPLAGAKLVFVAPEATTTTQDYREVPQTAFDEARFAEFRLRVEVVARGMAGAEFAGLRSAEGRGDGYDYRIHLVREVSEAEE